MGLTPNPNPPEHLPAQPPPGFALPEKSKRVLNPNRWSAFTNDELVMLDDWYFTADSNEGPLGQPNDLLAHEIRAELARRKAADGR